MYQCKMETRTDWRSCKRAESCQIARRQRWHIFLTGGRPRTEEDEFEDPHDLTEREMRALYAGDAECTRLITNWVNATISHLVRGIVLFF